MISKLIRRFVAAAAVVAAVEASPAPAPTASTAPTPYVPPLDRKELMRLDDPMRQYFDERVTYHTRDSTELRQIVSAILMPSGLHFAYEAEGTYDVREAFRRRRGNCVTFSLLVVAVARSFGFRADFQNVESAMRWDRYGKAITAVLHVNARVGTNDGIYVVDLRPDLLARATIDTLSVSPDDRVFAQFYSNIGFFDFLQGDTRSALRYIALATTVDSDFAGAWVNRGAVLAQLGDYAAARSSYERAVHLQPWGIAALDGYVDILKKLGTPDDLKEASRLERRANRVRGRNPYYQQHLADQARSRGTWAEADRLLRRAIALKSDEPEFYLERAAVLRKLGREDDARRVEDRLKSLQARAATVSPMIFR